jgi:hypothetical protein
MLYLWISLLRTVFPGGCRLTAGKTRLRLFCGKDLQINPCKHLKGEMP